MRETLNIQCRDEPLALITGLTFTSVPCWYDRSRQDLKMDLIVPKECAGHVPLPCFVWVCGGAFMVMDCSVWLPELMPFARAGYVVASVDYRVSSKAQFPAQLTDVKASIRYLRAHADALCIDPDRIFIAGESAGGTLACLAGVTSGLSGYDEGDYLEHSSAVQGVVDFYGITNIYRGACAAVDGIPAWVLDAFIGEGFTSKDAAAASVVHFVSPAAPPTMILHGTADPLIPVSQSEKLYELLQKNGVKSDLLLLEGALHGDDVFYLDEIVDRIIYFLGRISYNMEEKPWSA